MIKKVLNLYKKYEEIMNYIIVGGMTTIISILSYNLNLLLANVVRRRRFDVDNKLSSSAYKEC